MRSTCTCRSTGLVWGWARRKRVLVPLCGKTLDLAWLVAQGQPVLGVELSPIAVEALFCEQGLVPEVTDESPFRRYRSGALEVLCGDFFDLTQAHLGAVDAVYDRASLIALPPETRRGYAAHLMGLLSPETRILLITLDYDQAQMAGPPFAVAAGEVRDLFGGVLRSSPWAAWTCSGRTRGFGSAAWSTCWNRSMSCGPGAEAGPGLPCGVPGGQGRDPTGFPGPAPPP